MCVSANHGYAYDLLGLRHQKNGRRCPLTSRLKTAVAVTHFNGFCSQ